MTPPATKSRATRSKGVEPVALSKAEIAFVRSLVVFEDADILALNKPSGLSSQGGRGQVHTLDELLWAFAKPGKARPRLIHRLDRDTSGIILTAKTQPAASYLGKAMMAHKFSKTYQALVTPGELGQSQGHIDLPLRRDEVGREAFMRVCAPDHADSELALTRYRTLAAVPMAARLELSPQTGRMHQLRVHLAALGHPIAGDARYGGALTVGGIAVPRLMLHAAALRFPHPAGGIHSLQAPIPPDMEGLTQALGLQLT